MMEAVPLCDGPLVLQTFLDADAPRGLGKDDAVWPWVRGFNEYDGLTMVIAATATHPELFTTFFQASPGPGLGPGPGPSLCRSPNPNPNSILALAVNPCPNPSPPVLSLAPMRPQRQAGGRAQGRPATSCGRGVNPM